MSEQLRGKSEQLECSFEQVTSLSAQLERKSKQLRIVSEQRKGMAYRRFCFALLNSHIVADDYYACRARYGAHPTAPNSRATPGEEKKATGQAKKLAKELKGEYFMVGVTAGVIS